MNITLRYASFFVLVTASATQAMQGPRPVEPKPYVAPKQTYGSALNPVNFLIALGAVRAYNVTFADAAKQTPAAKNPVEPKKDQRKMSKRQMAAAHGAKNVIHQPRERFNKKPELDEFALRKEVRGAKFNGKDGKKK